LLEQGALLLLLERQAARVPLRAGIDEEGRRVLLRGGARQQRQQRLLLVHRAAVPAPPLWLVE